MEQFEYQRLDLIRGRAVQRLKVMDQGDTTELVERAKLLDKIAECETLMARLKAAPDERG